MMRKLEELKTLELPLGLPSLDNLEWIENFERTSEPNQSTTATRRAR